MTRDASVHPHVSHPSRGSLERREARHRPRLRLHPRHEPPPGSSPPRVRRPEARRRRSPARCEDGAGGAPLALRRLAPAVSRTSPQARARRRRLRQGLERADPTRKGARSGAGPSSCSAGIAGAEITLVRNPRYWGGRPAYLDRIVYRFCARLRQRDRRGARGLRQGELDLVHSLRVSAGQARAFRQLHGVNVKTGAGQVWEHLRFRLLPPGPRCSATSSCAGRSLRHRQDRSRPGALPRDRPGRAERQRRLFRTSRHYRPTGGTSATGRPSRPPVQAGGLPPGRDGIHVCPVGGSRCACSRPPASLARAGRADPDRAATARGRRARPKLPRWSAALFEHRPQGRLRPALSPPYEPVRRREQGLDVLRCGNDTGWTGYCQRLVDRDLDEASRVLDADLRACLNRIDARVALDVPMLPLFYQP